MEFRNDLATLETERLHEYCGIAAIHSPTPTRHKGILRGLGDALQHRGQLGCGFLFKQADGSFTRETGEKLLRDAYPDLEKRLPEESTQALLHLRYGTNGDWSSENLQPIRVHSKFGDIFVIHNGEFPGTESMRNRLNVTLPPGISDTAIFSQLLAETQADTIEDSLVEVLSTVNGAYSLIVSCGDKMLLARDPHGIRPLFIGRYEDNWVAASETFALGRTGIELVREVKRGEVISIDSYGLKTIEEGLDGLNSLCGFEAAYFQRYESKIPVGGEKENWPTMGKFRRMCGMLMAREHYIPNVDFVVGIPDSGLQIAAGYAYRSKYPLLPLIIRDHFNTDGGSRTFMMDDNAKAQKAAVSGKLSFDEDLDMWKDKIVVLGDDTFVRGTVSKNITQHVLDLGAKEVHWIIGFPPVMHTCHLGTSMRTQEELIAYRMGGDPRKIANELGATSVRYMTIKLFHEALLRSGGLSMNSRDNQMNCMGCVTGRYPVDREGNITYEP